MEKFLNELRNALKDAQVENADEIVTKYVEHFLVGHEAGMTDEEIIDRFGSIAEIVESYKIPSNKKERKFHLSLNLEIFAEFFIEQKDDDEIHLEADEDAFKYISVEKGLRTFALSCHKSYLRPNKPKYSGTLYIGKNMFFEEIFIKSVATDLEICPLKGEGIQIQNVSGDVELDTLNFSKRVRLSSTSGEFVAKEIISPNLMIETVNGDFKIKEICCDDVALKTVNGDINIERTNEANFVVSSVNGDVNIKEGKAKCIVKSNINGDISIAGECVGGKISNVMDSLKKAFEDWKW
ncbi:MAG: DUF4097 family beta strand repeat-containing protein [Anaeroplasmataceae bacterium]|nr:DUF4097 family beta strand repeat-containing protein [Anaeroplasmataceae bacterium]